MKIVTQVDRNSLRVQSKSGHQNASEDVSERNGMSQESSTVSDYVSHVLEHLSLRTVQIRHEREGIRAQVSFGHDAASMSVFKNVVLFVPNTAARIDSSSTSSILLLSVLDTTRRHVSGILAFFVTIFSDLEISLSSQVLYVNVFRVV